MGDQRDDGHERGRAVPRGWGRDELSAFIDAAANNMFATFDNLKNEWLLLANIDSTLYRFANSGNATASQLVPYMLAAYAHAAFRGAVRHAVSGEPPCAFMVLRGCLETALYAAYMIQNPDSVEVWLRRHDDEKSEGRAKSTFSYGNTRRSYEKLDAEGAQVVHKLYQRTIDFGAHPNERALTSNVFKTESDSKTEYNVVYLHSLGPAMLHVLKSTAEVGVVCLDVFQHAFVHRAKALNVEDEIRLLKSRVNELGPRWRDEMEKWNSQ